MTQVDADTLHVWMVAALAVVTVFVIIWYTMGDD
jgi:hypothetical protein